ncbi:unnamed protein product [Withania somnifera]
MLSRFSYEDLTVMTENFSKKLGEGAFGSVFEGTTSDGTKIAVKRLQGFGNVKKSFLAEVATIGSIQHVNLIRLIGFCAEKTYRLLVYEYMANGSLDRWIFHGEQEKSLTWDGLAYLHDDCNNKTIHLDVKPQNILLDHNFNAKVSYFGLPKLVGKDESKIVTTMRGKPGYLAPEWLNSVITEKVDVYSFGVVIMEIICGRKNLDVFKMRMICICLVCSREKQETQFSEMVDENCGDMQLHREEAVFPSPPTTRQIADANQEVEAVVGISLPVPSELSGPR